MASKAPSSQSNRKRVRNLSEGPSPSRSDPPVKRQTRIRTVPQIRRSSQEILSPSVARNIVDDIIRVEEEEERAKITESEEDEIFATPTPTMPTETETSGGDLIKEMTAYFDQKFERLPTREYMDGRMNAMDKHIQSNTLRIE